MAKKIDATDISILEVLQTNSKITNLELSKNIGLSPAPTLERVKKLEGLKIIDSYHAKVNPKKVGLTVLTFVLVDIAWQKEKALERFLEVIAEIPQIMETYVITGEADVLLKIYCEDIPAYEELIFTKLSRIEVIEKIKSLITLSTVKDSSVLPMSSTNARKNKK